MVRADKNISFPWLRVLEALAWVSLVAAFIIGQIAAQPDYEAMLQDRLPDIKLKGSKDNKELPVVYRIEEKGKESPDVMVMAEGVGYGGPLVVGVRARKTQDGARVNEVVLLTHKETPAFLQRLNQESFFYKLAGKNVTDDFIIGNDIDAISGASVSAQGFSAAIREAVHLGAVEHLKLKPTWQKQSIKVGINEVILVSLFVLAFVGAYRRDKVGKYARYVVMIGALLFVGFYANASVSIGNLASIVMGYIPSLEQHLLWWIMMLGIFGSVIFVGRNIYCHQICPFKVVQDLIQKASGIKLRIKPEVQRNARVFIFTLSWAALMLIFLSVHPALGSYEPFAMMFSLDGVGIQWYILPVALLGAFFVPSFWCRLFCPVGLYLNQMVRLRRSIIGRFSGGGRGRPGKKTIPVTVTTKSD
ncbi:4Fe-4S binding protein [Pseudomonadota bacterium]